MGSGSARGPTTICGSGLTAAALKARLAVHFAGSAPAGAPAPGLMPEAGNDTASLRRRRQGGSRRAWVQSSVAPGRDGVGMGGVGGDAGTIRTGLGAREHQRLLLAEDLSWLLGQQALHVRDTARVWAFSHACAWGWVARPEPDARRTPDLGTGRSSTRPPTASTACRLPPRPPRQEHLILAALQSTAVSPDGINFDLL